MDPPPASIERDAGHAHDVDPVDGPLATLGGYHPHAVSARHEPARELVGARAAHACARDEELMQVENPHPGAPET